MATMPTPKAVLILEPVEGVKVWIMDNGTIRIIGDVSALRGVDARKLAYALMSAGAQV
jgi:hypothetical protein